MKTRRKQKARGNSRRKSSRPRIVAHAALPTRHGKFTILGIEGSGPEEVVVVLRHGPARGRGTPLVRIHSQCLTGDVLASERCDCRAQLEMSLRKIAAAPSGLLLYVPQEGRGIGLLNKLRAYELQDGGMDTVEANQKLGFAADSRDYRFSAEVLRLLGARRVRLLSNSPDKVQQLETNGIRVVERVPCRPRSSKASRAYLETKRAKMGHFLRP
jgi:GTP cyclohydrolase II